MGGSENKRNGMTEVKEHFSEIPTMTSEPVHRYLTQLGIEWKGLGAAMELGCWLGASSVPLLMGLITAGYDKQFWAFDNWVANEQQVGMAREWGIEIQVGEALMPLYNKNVSKIYYRITTIFGMIPGTLVSYSGDPIEICILDAPKKNPVFINTIRALYKYWIPGVTILGLLDYKFYQRFEGKKREQLEAPARFIEDNKDSFELIREWDNECPVFFKYIKPLKNI